MNRVKYIELTFKQLLNLKDVQLFTIKTHTAAMMAFTEESRLYNIKLFFNDSALMSTDIGLDCLQRNKKNKQFFSF